MLNRTLLSRVAGVVRNPGFWLLVLIYILLTIIHHAEGLRQPEIISNITGALGLRRHAAERILYMAPVVWAGFLFGWRGAVTMSFFALAAMVPRIFYSEVPADAIFETAAVFIISNVLAISFEALKREREYRTQIELAQQELKSNIEVIRENERRLGALNQIASTVSRSLELNQVLNTAIDNVVDVMQVEMAWIYLLEETSAELILAVYRGVGEEFVRGIDRLKVGEGMNGQVAQSGEPMYIEDAAHDPRLTRQVVMLQGIHAMLVVPLSSKGVVNGTLTVSTHEARVFTPQETDLLKAIGNQIGVAVDNARLYRKQREVAEELRISEERYRELFQNAHDAIWLHDFRGTIIAVNNATEKMTGYTVPELTGMNVKTFLTEDSLRIAGTIRRQLLTGQSVEQPYEQRLIRKDGSEAIVQLATSVVSDRGRPVAFQHIARDTTEEKRLRENLRFYVRQATKAQEEERKRISQELHDDTIQRLVALSRRLDMLAAKTEGTYEKRKAALEQLIAYVNDTIQGVRRMSQDLRPAALDRLGLIPALEWLANDVTQYSKVATGIRVEGTPRRLSEEEELVLFRIAQEALRNVWKHAEATGAEIQLVFNTDKISICVTDNGKGFALPDKIGDLARLGKLGLAGMQERAQLVGGMLSVQSEPGRGTTVTVEIPGQGFAVAG